MRKLVILAVLATALAVPAFAFAGVPPIPGGVQPSQVCGPACNGGGPLTTGCWQQQSWTDGGFDYLDHYHHYVVLQWCKYNGVITSIGIAQHGCDTSGFVSCSVGPGWITSGGIGYGSATFEAHAQVAFTPARFFGYNFTSVVSGSVPPG